MATLLVYGLIQTREVPAYHTFCYVNIYRRYKEVYLKAYQNGKDARTGISDYFRFYNTARPHQALGYRTPGDVFTSTPFEESEKGVIESLTTSTIDAAGHYLNLAPLLS